MNIILDIGNVICKWNPKELVAQVFHHPDEQETALNSIVQQEIWQGLDRGTVELAEAIQKTWASSQLDPERIATLYHAVPEHLQPIPDMVQTIEQAAAANIPLYVLSNMHQHSWEYLTTHYDFWEKFKGIVVSWEIHLLKPEPAIYAYITEKYNLIPQETYFLDDMLENVEAAQEFGLQAQLVSDSSLGANILRKILQQ